MAGERANREGLAVAPTGAEEVRKLAGELADVSGELAATLRALAEGSPPRDSDACDVVVELVGWAEDLLNLAEPLALGWRRVYVARLLSRTRDRL